MKKFLGILALALCFVLPRAALADDVAAWDIPVYQIEPANGLLYTDGVLSEGTAYRLMEHVVPEPGTALADYFITSGPIEWGRFITPDGGRTGLIVLNPGVILDERSFSSEAEAAEAERRYADYGDAYIFLPMDQEDAIHQGDAALVLCESLTMRAQPEVSATALASLPYGTTLMCTGVWQPGWLEVTAEEQTGWVREEFLLLNPRFITFAGETPVLAWPSPDAPWIGLLSAGASAPIIGECDGYTVISLRGASGFVK